MHDNTVGVRKTRLAEGYLERQLSELSGTIADSLANAKAADPQADCDGLRRSGEIANALNVARVSAQLGMAIAKLRSESIHRTVVYKVEGKPDLNAEENPPPDAIAYPPHYEGETPLFTEEEWAKEPSNEELWARADLRRQERARHWGWIA
jgi:hypothetical protein